jgi:hypothetical protein
MQPRIALHEAGRSPAVRRHEEEAVHGQPRARQHVPGMSQARRAEAVGRMNDRRYPYWPAEMRGGRDRDRTCDFCRVKAHSSGFAAQVDHCERVADLVVRCPLLSVAVPQIPPSCGPSAARTGGERPPSDYVAFSIRSRTGVRYPGSVGTWHDPDLAGQSQRRWSDARSCSASTWPPSTSWPPRSSRTSAPTAPGSGASCSLSGSSGPRPMAGAGAATSTADRPQPPTHSQSGMPRHLCVMSHLSTVPRCALQYQDSWLTRAFDAFPPVAVPASLGQFGEVS